MDAEPNYDDLTGNPTATQRDATGLLLPLFVGWQIQLLLFGLCLSMFYDYLQSEIYVRHSKKMKASLWGIIALLCMTSLLSAEELCYFGVWQKRTFLDIVTAHWPSGIEPILTAFVGSWVQVLLTLRAAAFFPRDWRRIAFLLVNFSLIFVAIFGACCVGAIGWLFTYGNPDNALPLTFYNSTIVWLFATAGVDVAISAGLAVQVRKRLADAGVAGWAFKSLITTALQTAAYTALFAVGGAVAVIAALATGNTPSTIDSCWAFWLPCHHSTSSPSLPHWEPTLPSIFVSWRRIGRCTQLRDTNQADSLHRTLFSPSRSVRHLHLGI
ncbi:hypothetical protein BCR35DRAFT_304411 [Leucosporidium creatinivorum]|uniref:Uncharacterized protein n=1 Tax=Leucosporidium creatinivorum TaxID=106004 RepID=A0A1Y2F8L3_9BASI|nr:hypothetical protein BCR35DRAFT_304411 [Leucosporidium creatinivorum]